MFFSKNFFFLAVFVKKWLSPRKNFQREIFFEIDFFGLEYVLKHSESIWKKNFETFFKNSDFWPFLIIFSHFWPFFQKISKSMFSPKMLLIYSQSIPSKKKFFSKLFSKCSFFGHFWSFFDCFWPFSNFLGRKMKKQEPAGIHSLLLRFGASWVVFRKLNWGGERIRIFFKTSSECIKTGSEV